MVWLCKVYYLALDGVSDGIIARHGRIGYARITCAVAAALASIVSVVAVNILCELFGQRESSYPVW